MYNLQICIFMVVMWLLDYLCPSHNVKLNSGQTHVELINGRGTHVV